MSNPRFQAIGAGEFSMARALARRPLLLDPTR